MTDKVKMTLTFEVEADQADAFVLRRALRKHPGAPMWLRHYLEGALERVVRDAHDGGRWKFEVSGGRLKSGE
jgi:hypothetical protein